MTHKRTDKNLFLQLYMRFKRRFTYVNLSKIAHLQQNVAGNLLGFAQKDCSKCTPVRAHKMDFYGGFSPHYY